MPQNRQLETLFLREKPAKILLGLKTAKDGKGYATVLSRETNCTYSHTIKILNLLKKHGLVTFEKSGRIKVLMKTKVTQIKNNSVLLEYNGQPMEIPNDIVIVCAGGTLPIPLLKEIGVRVETRFGT